MCELKKDTLNNIRENNNNYGVLRHIDKTPLIYQDKNKINKIKIKKLSRCVKNSNA